LSITEDNAIEIYRDSVILSIGFIMLFLDTTKYIHVKFSEGFVRGFRKVLKAKPFQLPEELLCSSELYSDRSIHSSLTSISAKQTSAAAFSHHLGTHLEHLPAGRLPLPT
jgi:hypothetical protein